MRRIKDGFLETIERIVPLVGRSVVEVGCGDGSRSVQIANACRKLTALDPDQGLVSRAKAINSRPHIRYLCASADDLLLLSGEFDVVIFTLSFHHVPGERMRKSIDEAIRVLKPNGSVIFLEPTFTGSFFEGEIRFDACDGDERKEKALAYFSILSHPGLEEVAEVFDETIFQFESIGDYRRSLDPKRNLGDLEAFLQAHDYTLRAERRINIFRPISVSVRS